MDKEFIRSAIIETLRNELNTLSSAALASKLEATDENNKQEGKYDMRAQSAAYLAEGQAKLAADLAIAIEAYRTLPLLQQPTPFATVGSLVTLSHKSAKNVYFIGPTRGGLELDIKGTPITVITASSPVGRELLNKKIGDTLLLGKNTWHIHSIN